LDTVAGANKRSAREQGDDAEGLAAEHFERCGYRVVARNYMTQAGEVDLVVEKGIALVFVEVRFRRSIAFGAPADTVTPSKQRRVVLAALDYVTRRGQMSRLIRFDVVSVRRTREGPRLEHIEGAFDAGF
jgi:putative endonuclease